MFLKNNQFLDAFNTFDVQNISWRYNILFLGGDKETLVNTNG